MELSISQKIFIFLLTIISRSWRMKVKGTFPEKPSIIIFWHGFMLPVWKIFSKFQPYGVVSQSKDGEILSCYLEKIGFRLIRGSSSSGGKKVIEDMISISKNNYLLITPDGARGPVYKLKAGALVVSQRTGVPVYICSVKISSAFNFKKSWDKFSFPLPFTKIILTFSEKIVIPESLDRNEVTAIIQETEKKMNKMYAIL